MTVRVGEYHVGIRCDDRDLLGLLRWTYRDAVVEEDRGDADLAVVVSCPSAGGGARMLPSLLHGRRALLRTRSVERLLHRLDLELGSLDTELPEPELGIHGLGAVTIGRSAALLPADVFDRGSAFEREVRRLELCIVEPVRLGLDAPGRRLIVPSSMTGRTGLGATPGGVYSIDAIWSSSTEHDATSASLVGLLRCLTRESMERLPSVIVALRDLVEDTRWVPGEGRRGPQLIKGLRAVAERLKAP